MRSSSRRPKIDRRGPSLWIRLELAGGEEARGTIPNDLESIARRIQPQGITLEIASPDYRWVSFPRRVIVRAEVLGVLGEGKRTSRQWPAPVTEPARGSS